MPKTQTVQSSPLGSFGRQALGGYSLPLAKANEWDLAWYNIENLAQDQVVIRIVQGKRIETYRGRRIGIDEDSQSDFTAPVLFATNEVFNLVKILGRSPWKYNAYYEEPFEYKVVEEETGEQTPEITADEGPQWTSSQIASAILNPQAESNMPHFREMLLIAEDTAFSAKESKKLAPRLLSFAEEYRNSKDPQDEAVVLSAIRTGASMLRPQNSNCLLSLLEPGHSIETSLVTVKMLGRIFEAQPPMKADEYQSLAEEVFQIAKSLLNSYAITSTQSAAMAHLAIYALVAMASSKINQIVEDVCKLDVMWFTRRTIHKLNQLSSIWANSTPPAPEVPRQLLAKALQTMECT